MKKSIVIITALAGFIAACQNMTPEQKIDSLAKAPDTAVTENRMCYTYLKQKDTVSLSLTKVGNAVTGELNYNFYEKDKNSGTMAGTVKGDTILAEYTFNSEGKSSVREVAFLQKGDQLIEGYGPVAEKGGKTVFTNHAELKFGEGVALSLIPCK